MNLNDGVQTTELFDPATNAFTLGPNMTVARYWHSATLLPSGKVLIAGGASSGGIAVASCELYDPATNTIALTGPMAAPRREHGAVLLNTGKVRPSSA